MLTISYWDGLFIHTLVWNWSNVSLANETWCAVTVPPFDFVKGDCAVGNAVLGKQGYKLSTEYKFYSRKFTNLTVVAPSCKTTGKNSELTKSAAMFFSTVYVMLQAVYTTAEKEFWTIAVLWLALTHKSSHSSQKMKQHGISSRSL